MVNEQESIRESNRSSLPPASRSTGCFIRSSCSSSKTDSVSSSMLSQAATIDCLAPFRSSQQSSNDLILCKTVSRTGSWWMLLCFLVRRSRSFTRSRTGPAVWPNQANIRRISEPKIARIIFWTMPYGVLWPNGLHQESNLNRFPISSTEEFGESLRRVCRATSKVEWAMN